MTSKKTVPKKAPRSPITFRISPVIKQRLIEISVKQNIDPSDVYRAAFNEGLKQLHGYQIQGNKLVE